MRSLYAFILGVVLTVASHDAFAQLGNEWINFSQSYYKVPVAKNGIYKLDYTDLQAAGFPVSSVDPVRIQIYHRGTEQSIYIEGQSDGQFNPSDFIEFYGRRNDGTLDKDLYKNPLSQPHQLYNLYSDTTSYFLTVGSLPGKRMVAFSETNVGGLTAEPNHIDEKLMVLTSQYSAGLDYGEVQMTTGDLGEGWTGVQVLQTQFLDYTISNITQTVTGANAPQLEMLVVGRGPMEHLAEVYAGSRLVGTINYSGFGAYLFTAPIQWTDISGGALVVRLRCVGVGGQPDRVSASYIRLKYAQRTNQGAVTEKVYTLLPNANDKSYIELENAPSGTRIYDITDPESLVRIGTTSTATINAIIPSTATSRKLLATNVTTTPAIKPVTFRPILPGQASFVIISHPQFRKAALGYSDPVKSYASYRASVAGGGHDTLVVNIQQLYDQFNYGETSATAIYHFMKYLTSSKLPEYLLLIGKGLDPNYDYFRNPNHPAFATFKDYVPSAGFPGADMEFTAGLAGAAENEPAVPTGRIPALKSEDVAAYLNKVIEIEAQPYNDLWRKNLLHLSGGINEGEPQLFKAYLQDFQVAAEDYYLGGKVSAVAKHSKEIQQINVAAQVNAGLNLITFFGHSSATTTDFEIGYVTDPLQGYNNKGKYPVLLMNGCNAGSSFLAYTLSGEDWVTAKDRGAVGVIAHSAYGFTSLLKEYSQMFYSVGYQDTTVMKTGIGDIQKETVRRFLQTQGNSAPTITQAQQMVLLGDPAVHLFGAKKPDLEINDNNVSVSSFDGQPITVATDSFAITMIVRNFGQARKDTIRIEVQRTLNDNTMIVYDSLYPSTKYSDTLTFVIRKGREEGSGSNAFKVTIDPDDVLDEITKENNTAAKGLVIPLNGTKNLFPVNFGIVHAQQINLSFQATDVFSKEREFTVELDTTNTFDSPFRKQFTARGDVLARQTISLLDQDTTAYYWRTKLTQPKPGESDQWTLSSFTYIKDGEDGWAQVHFPQYLTNQAEGLVRDSGLRKLKYLESVTPVSITTYGSNHPAPFTDVSLKIANAEFNLYGPGYDCRDNSFNLVAFDRKSTVPYLGVKFEWFNRAGRVCGRKPWVINNYVPSQMVTGNNDDLIQYVDNIQTGDSVIMYSIGDAGYSTWPALARNKLSELGVSLAQLNVLQDGEPVIMVGRKGSAPGTAIVYRADGAQKDLAVLSASRTITGGYTNGKMSSGLIGPALQWKQFTNSTAEVEVVDEVAFDVVAVKLNGEESIVFNQVTGNRDLSTIDASVYPYVRIMFSTDDETNLTSSQLSKWLVTYTPVPEGMLLFNDDKEQVRLNEGESWKGSYKFFNISDRTFPDSLSVQYELFNEAKRTTDRQNMKIKAPLPGDSTVFDISVNTFNRGGLNDVDVFVNPRLVPEQYYDNNFLQLTAYLNVAVEDLRPVLDVTIDNRHLIGGDFVSPSPVIVARIWDDNKYILKADTTGVRIFLSYPCSGDPCPLTQILLTRQDVKWYAATATTPFRVEFTPANLTDGVYKLRIEGADARGNQSGVDPYVIAFTVKNESTVTIHDPYPNPFTTDVTFDIILTGQVLPEVFDMQLINVNGQLQSRFQASDFMPFHSGTNQFIWKGTDSNGNTLPAGVYIYKVSLLMNGQQVRRIGKLIMVR